ncbi:response regulator transcription factor [Defluviitalea saccharophila]|uniref:Stage 0 sporulation protein A homolog n=1 Tax=Defluviitalea saccharophila TaxID=879970 RepID=A0ABZ2Y710_9FIRM
MKIMIVEDEFHIRTGLSKLLSSMGEAYELIGEAEDGYEGMIMIKQLQPDVVITDIKMPKLDGLQMISNIRQCNMNVIFVILSGYAEFEYAQKGISLGVEEYLLKPITVSQFKETMERILYKLSKENKEEIKERHQQYSPFIVAILSDIEENYAQKISLDDYAEQFKMTPEYISRIFSKEVGVTFSNYLTEVRMNKAKQLLLDKSYKIYEIACMVGYNDVQYFCRVFKKFSGLSAKEYVIKHNKKFNL